MKHHSNLSASLATLRRFNRKRILRSGNIHNTPDKIFIQNSIGVICDAESL
jgi:hypothetical protein